MKLKISAKYFPGLQITERKKGENRLQYFLRHFGNRFAKPELEAITKFINLYGYQPMLPNWADTRGCYELTAISHFRYYNMKNENRNKVISAIWLADQVHFHKKVYSKLLKMSDKVWKSFKEKI